MGQPSPKYRAVAEASLAGGGVDAGEEIAGQHVLEKNGVAGEGAAGDDG